MVLTGSGLLRIKTFVGAILLKPDRVGVNAVVRDGEAVGHGLDHLRGRGRERGRERGRVRRRWRGCLSIGMDVSRTRGRTVDLMFVVHADVQVSLSVFQSISLSPTKTSILHIFI